MFNRVSRGALCAALGFGLGCGVVAGGAAVAQDSDGEPYFTGLVVFGDSLSDPGNQPAITGIDTPPAPYFQNQFSSGPVFSTLYDDLLGFEADRALNFAVGGAQFGTTNINPLLNGTGISAQIAGYLATNPTIADTDLFHVLGGANNYFAALGAISADPANAATLLSDSVNATIATMAADTQSLLAAGAHQFVLPNLPNLGGTPLFTGIGQPALGFNFSLLHNNGVASVATGLNDQGAIAYVVDSFTIGNDVQANPSKYGLTNVTEPCFNQTAMTLCADPETYQFFDDVHPTGAGHEILAAATADTLIAPRTISAQTETSLAASRAFLNRLRSPLAAGQFDDDGQRVFADVSLTQMSRDNQAYAVGYEADELALTFGFTERYDNGLTVGFAGQLSDGQTDLNSGLGGFDRTGYRGAVFMAVPAGPLALRGAASAGLDQLSDISRNTGVADQVAMGETDIGVIGVDFEASLPLMVSDTLVVAPYARAILERASSQQYDETGAVGLNQRVFRSIVDRSDAEIGARGAARFAPFTISGDVAYVTAIGEADANLSSALTSVLGVVRTLPGAELSTDYVRFAGDVSFDVGSGVRLSVGGVGASDQDDGEELTGFIRLSRALGE